MKEIVVTGAAGFIGYNTAQQLLKKGYRVIGIDNVNDYYDTRLKKYRMNILKKDPNYVFYRADIESLPAMRRIFNKHPKPKAIINLAARAGVRYSMENPFVYVSTNVMGTLNLLEMCRQFGIKKYVLASTSSLYAGQKMPFSETLPVNTPISPYAATKKGAEALCYSYHYLFNIDISIVRYFTVYGPCGRPDMSLFRFIKWIDEGTPIELFGDGSQSRDFTYVEDIARGTVAAAMKKTGFKVMNLGGNSPHVLSDVIHLIESCLGKRAKYRRLPFHKADIVATWADISEAEKTLRWKPRIGIEEGVKRTVDWYKENRSWLKNVRL